MFFDIVPNTISSVLTVLFPIFASYKALRTSDPSHLAPWLMYWVVVSLFNLAESFLWLITWLPFYAWLRLFLHLYLLIPGAHAGATHLYTTRVDPFLAEHEAQIERLISDAHDRAKSAGWGYLQDLLAFVRRHRILGLEPPPPTAPERDDRPPPTARGQRGYGSYAQALLARFDLPSVAAARPVAGDLYGLVSEALAGAARGATGGGGAAVERELVPPEVHGRERRASYVAQSRETLRSLLAAFERESAQIEEMEEDDNEDGERRVSGARRRGGGGGEGLGRNRSELDFEAIDRDEAAGRPASGRRTTSGGWMPWNWGGKREESGSGSENESEEEQRRRSRERARTSGNDLAY